MEVYLITIFFLSLFSFCEIIYKYNYKSSVIISFLIFTLLILQFGFRWETGTDWQPYLTHFNSISYFDDILPSILVGFEPGYTLFVYLIKLFSNNYTLFLFLHSILYFSLIFISIKRLSPYFFTSLLIFYCSTLGYLGSNRQLLSIAICFTSLPYIVDRNYLKFTLIVFFASMFHLTAIIFFIFYFLNARIKLQWLFIILISSIIIGYSSLPIYIFSYIGNLIGGVSLSKSDFYINNAEDSLSNNALGLFGAVKRLILLFIFYINLSRINKISKYYNLIFNGFFIGILIYFLFSNSLIIIVNRGSLYFSFLECILISYNFLLFRNIKLRVLFFLIYIFYSITIYWQSVSSHFDLFVPYKGIFYNTEYNRMLY